MMRCKNKVLLSLIFGIFLISMFSFISSADLTTGDVTLCNREKICDSYWNGNVTVNISIPSSFRDQNWSSVNVYVYSTGSTANTSVYLINDSSVKGFTQNYSDNISVVINSAPIQDGNDYTVIFNLWNSTKHLNITQTGYIVDNGEPTAPTSLLPLSDTDGTVNFSATTTDSTTTGCYMNFTNYNPGKNSYNATYQTTSCSLQLTSVPDLSYLWFVTASDGSNATISSVQTTNVDIKTGSTKGSATYIVGQATDVTGSKTLSLAGDGSVSPAIGWIIGLLVVAGIIIGIFLYIKKK